MTQLLEKYCSHLLLLWLIVMLKVCTQITSDIYTTLEPICCKKQQKCSWPVTGLQNKGPLKDLNDSKLIVYESKWFPWSTRMNFIPFRSFRGPLLHKPVIGQELFFAVSYSKPALVLISNLSQFFNIFDKTQIGNHFNFKGKQFKKENISCHLNSI